MGLISAWWNGSQSQICLLTGRHCCLIVSPVQPYLHLQIVNSLRGCAGISPFKSTKHSASIVLCAQSASKEISLLKNNHICQQFPVPAPHQQVLSHALFSLSPQNTSPGRIIIATFTDKDHLTSKVAELEPRFPIWKLSIPWCSFIQKNKWIKNKKLFAWMKKQKQGSLNTAILCSLDLNVHGFTPPDPWGDDD